MDPESYGIAPGFNRLRVGVIFLCKRASYIGAGSSDNQQPKLTLVPVVSGWRLERVAGWNNSA
jgi:hypothetical protein